MSDQLTDRITLSEAMGGPIWEAYINPGKNPECVELPNPFISADDDYKVLEWMRTVTGRYEADRQEMPKINWKIFCDQLCSRGLYDIGDYARAALKVLK